MVADAGRQQRDGCLRMDEGFNQYERPVGCRRRRTPAEPQRPRVELRAHQRHEAEAPMMWNANWAGPMYGYQTYSRPAHALDAWRDRWGRDGAARDARVRQGVELQTPLPVGLHLHHEQGAGPGPELVLVHWLWTTESVDSAIADVTTAGTKTTITVRQDGEMPSPVILKIQLAPGLKSNKPVTNAQMVDDNTAIVTWPVDVWLNGSRTFQAVLDFGRPITTVTFDPNCRFPDRDATDNVWPKERPILVDAE